VKQKGKGTGAGLLLLHILKETERVKISSNAYLLYSNPGHQSMPGVLNRGKFTPWG